MCFLEGVFQSLFVECAMTLAPFIVTINKAMDKDTLITRLQELKDELARIDKKLMDLDDLLVDGVTDEAVKAYAEGIQAVLDEREPVLNEVRQLILMSYQEDLDGDGVVN